MLEALARASDRPAYMVCDPSTVIVHHGVSEQEAIKRGPDTTAQIGIWATHTRNEREGPPALECWEVD